MKLKFSVRAIVFLLTICFQQAHCYNVNPEKGRKTRIEKIVKSLKKENVYQYYFATSPDESEETAYAIIIERYDFLSFKLIVYKVNNKTGKTNEVFRENHFPYLILRVIPIPKGFITISRAGMGRRFQYFAYTEKDNKLKQFVLGHYDILELAYYEGYDTMPHLFASEYGGEPYKTNQDKIGFMYTHIFEWDKKNKSYKYLKKLESANH